MNAAEIFLTGKGKFDLVKAYADFAKKIKFAEINMQDALIYHIVASDENAFYAISCNDIIHQANCCMKTQLKKVGFPKKEIPPMLQRLITERKVTSFIRYNNNILFVSDRAKKDLMSICSFADKLTDTFSYAKLQYKLNEVEVKDRYALGLSKESEDIFVIESFNKIRDDFQIGQMKLMGLDKLPHWNDKQWEVGSFSIRYDGLIRCEIFNTDPSILEADLYVSSITEFFIDQQVSNTQLGVRDNSGNKAVLRGCSEADSVKLIRAFAKMKNFSVENPKETVKKDLKSLSKKKLADANFPKKLKYPEYVSAMIKLANSGTIGDNTYADMLQAQAGTAIKKITQ